MKRTLPVILSLLLSLTLLPNAGAFQNVFILDQDTGIQLPNAAAWTESDFFPQAYGPNYSFDRRDGSAGGPTLTIRTPGALDPIGGGTAGTSGTVWDVYGRWSQGSGRCSNVRIEVRRNNGASLVLSATRDMRPTAAGLNWEYLGGFTAVVGQNYEVRYYANNTIVSGVPSTAIGCVVSPDGAMFVKRTFDGSDISNLNNADIIDEAGLEDGTAGSNSLGGATIANCASYTTLRSISVTVPASSNTSYVFCQAAGDIDFDTADAEVRVGIDGPDAGNVPERQRLLGIEGVNLGSNDETDRKAWAVQNVYTVSSAGATQTYSLVGCKDEIDTVDPGTLTWDPFVCLVIPTGR